MQKLHQKLIQKYQTYNTWHQTKHHNKIHWGAFVVFTFFVFGMILRWTPITFAADIAAPTTPTNLTATTISSSQINLSWTASTDNVGVTGYKIYRDGTLVTRSQGHNVTSYSDTNLQPSTTYSYTVSAFDDAGNESGQSSQITKTTSAISASQKVVVLTLDKAEAAVSQYPVSSGIPFPRGELFSTDNLRLLDAQNQEIPMQAHSLVNWPDGSIKSALIQFEADVSQTETKTFNLEYGADVKRTANPPTTVKVIQDSQAITIDTGKIKLEFSKTSFTLFNQVWIDQNNNQAYEDSEKTLSNPGDIFLVNAFDNKEYKASLYQSPTYTIEETGPIRAVIKAEGKLQNQDGEQLTDFKVWIYAYAGSEQVKIDYTLVDTREEKNVYAKRTQLALSVKSYGLKIPFNLSNSEYSFGGENGEVYSGAITGEHYLSQAGIFNWVNYLQDPPYAFTYEGVGTGKKAPGWVDVSNNAIGISAILKNFWQQFPKELAIKDNNLVLYLHPDKASLPISDLQYPALDGITKEYKRPNTFYSPREGMAKTYEILFNFHKGDGAQTKLDNLNKVFQSNYPFLTASASWYAKSQVFGNLIEAGPWSAGYDKYLIDEIYQPSVGICKEKGCLAFPYGWRDFGDRLRAGGEYLYGPNYEVILTMPTFYNDTHVGANTFFIQYLRTKDIRWWELGEIASRHWMDIDVSHANRLGYWPKGFGPGEGHMVKHEMVDHDDGNIHPGHAHISGLPDYYLLTGDRRALEVMKEAGDWWVNAAPVFFPTDPFPYPHIAEIERDYAWPLYTLNEAFRASGDTKYLKAAAQIVNHLILWWQTKSDHWVNGEIVSKNDWTKGTGWWYMYPRMDNSPMPALPGNWTTVMANPLLYNGTTPWTAGALLSAIIQFYELNDDYNYVDSYFIREMLLQTMNYVVKWTWDESKLGFLYGEAIRNVYDRPKYISNHILFPLAYLGALYQELKQQGALVHPEWYDTAFQWLNMAKMTYNEWKIVEDKAMGSSAGWYGYEMIYPADFWSLMRSLEETKTLDILPPSIPVGLAANAISSSQINLSWTASTDNVGVTGYKIYRCAGSACAPTTQIATSATNSYLNTGLTASTAYTYAVSAYDVAGNESGKSSSVSATTLAGFKPSDLNKDTKVDQQDFDILKQGWNRTDKPPSDINQDGIVDSRDLGILMSEWGG